MRTLLLAVTIAISATSTAFAQAAPAAPASTPAPTTGYSVSETDVGTLIDNAATKAILDKHLPGFSGNDQVAMARSMTLKNLQQYAPDTFTDKVLGEIQSDLDKLSKK
jgi:para-nitrobenzyl esterase